MEKEDTWKLAGEVNRKQNEFVAAYIAAHYGPFPADPVLATSEALKAYYATLGLRFAASDEDAFIYPDEIRTGLGIEE